MNEQEKQQGIAIKNKDDLKKLKKEIKKEVVKEHGISEEQAKLYEEVVKEAQMPVTMKDEDFTLGVNELDIRGLSKENKEQMAFRQGVLNIIYQKQIMTSLIDISRLIMVIADKLGVEDLIQATDDVIEKTKKIRADLKGFVKETDKA